MKMKVKGKGREGKVERVRALASLASPPLSRSVEAPRFAPSPVPLRPRELGPEGPRFTIATRHIEEMRNRDRVILLDSTFLVPKSIHNGIHWCKGYLRYYYISWKYYTFKISRWKYDSFGTIFHNILCILYMYKLHILMTLVFNYLITNVCLFSNRIIYRGKIMLFYLLENEMWYLSFYNLINFINYYYYLLIYH